MVSPLKLSEAFETTVAGLTKRITTESQRVASVSLLAGCCYKCGRSTASKFVLFVVLSSSEGAAYPAIEHPGLYHPHALSASTYVSASHTQTASKVRSLSSSSALTWRGLAGTSSLISSHHKLTEED